VQVTVPLTLTLTVPDQFTADFLHTSTAQPSYPSPRNSSALATRVDAAGLSLSGLARNGAFHHVAMSGFAATLQRASLPYPLVVNANVSMIMAEASANFTAVRSPQVDALQASLLAFAEAAAFELHLAVQALPELTDSIDVRITGLFRLLVSLLLTRQLIFDTLEHCSVLLHAAPLVPLVSSAFPFMDFLIWCTCISWECRWKGS
jgi:hypothetical protein